MDKNNLKYLNLEEVNDLIGAIKETHFDSIYNKTGKLEILKQYKQKIERGEIQHLDLNDITLEEAKFFDTALISLENAISAHNSNVYLLWDGAPYNLKLHLKIQDFIEDPSIKTTHSVMLKPQEVAKKLRVSKYTVYRYINKGSLPAIRLEGSNRFLIKSDDLESCYEKLKKPMREHAKRAN